MTNEEAIKWIISMYNIANQINNCMEYKESLNMAIQALEQTSHLIDRPCEACEFHKENGCSKWGCVFEEDEDENEKRNS